jgi:hypothetical protein
MMPPHCPLKCGWRNADPAPATTCASLVCRSYNLSQVMSRAQQWAASTGSKWSTYGHGEHRKHPGKRKPRASPSLEARAGSLLTVPPAGGWKAPRNRTTRRSVPFSRHGRRRRSRGRGSGSGSWGERGCGSCRKRERGGAHLAVSKSRAKLKCVAAVACACELQKLA